MLSCKPWYRDFDGWWYCTVRVDGKQRQRKLVQGRDNEATAEDLYHKLMLKLGHSRSNALSLPALSTQFLAAHEIVFVRRLPRLVKVTSLASLSNLMAEPICTYRDWCGVKRFLLRSNRRTFRKKLRVRRKSRALRRTSRRSTLHYCDPTRATVALRMGSGRSTQVAMTHCKSRVT